MRTIRRYPDPEAVSRAAAHDFVELARTSIAERGRFCVALSGGSTPRRMYQILSEGPRWAQLPWERVEFFWGDERAVPPDHPDSNFGAAAASLLRKLAIPDEHIHRMQGELPDVEDAAARYQAELARVFGVRATGCPRSSIWCCSGWGRTATPHPSSRTASL